VDENPRDRLCRHAGRIERPRRIGGKGGSAALSRCEPIRLYRRRAKRYDWTANLYYSIGFREWAHGYIASLLWHGLCCLLCVRNSGRKRWERRANHE
jgi:hypothetical protein